MTELRTVGMELGRTDAGVVVLGKSNCLRLLLTGTKVERTPRVRGWLLAALAVVALTMPAIAPARTSTRALRHGEFGMEASLGLLGGHGCRKPPCPVRPIGPGPHAGAPVAD